MGLEYDIPKRDSNWHEYLSNEYEPKLNRFGYSSDVFTAAHDEVVEIIEETVEPVDFFKFLLED